MRWGHVPLSPSLSLSFIHTAVVSLKEVTEVIPVTPGLQVLTPIRVTVQGSEDAWGGKLRKPENHCPDSVTSPTLAPGPNSGGLSQEVGVCLPRAGVSL